MASDLEMLKQGRNEFGIHELIHQRWSPRAYSERGVSGQDLRKIFAAASWAASSSNEQPWRFVVGHRGDETHGKILDTLVEFNQTWAKAAPVLVMTVAKLTFTKDGKENQWAMHDTGAASANMCLQAIALGIHTHGMAGFDREKARANLALPADFAAVAVWAVGYLGDPATLPEYMQKSEVAPRVRKGLAQIVFRAWDVPAEIAEA